MNARNKLNAAYVNGAIIIAAILGMICQSWVVFFVALAVGIAVALVAGEIRPTSTHHRHR